MLYMYCVFMFHQRRGRLPSPRKAGRELRRAVLFIREVYSDLCRFHGRKFRTLLFHLKRELCKRQKKSCNQFVVLRVWLPRAFGGKDVTFYFYMFEICVSLQTPNLMSCVLGCKYGGGTELNRSCIQKVS